MSERTILIGDIHGCYPQMMQIFERVHFDPDKDRLISMGDLIDRGHYSYEVVRFFMDMKEKMGDRCVIIRGNHEQMFLDSIEDEDMAENWVRNGKASTVESFCSHGEDVNDYYEWIRDNTVYYHIDEYFQCVHGGLDEENPADNHPLMLVWDRDALFFNKYKGRLTIVGHTPLILPAYYDGTEGPAHIMQYQLRRKLPTNGIFAIDTACYGHNLLSVMVVEGDEYYLEGIRGPMPDALEGMWRA